MYIIHVNFNFPFRLEPKVGLHITHECTSWLRFYGKWQIFTGWMPFLLLSQQCQSTEGNVTGQLAAREANSQQQQSTLGFRFKA